MVFKQDYSSFDEIITHKCNNTVLTIWKMYYNFYRLINNCKMYYNFYRLINNCKILHLKSYKVSMPYSFFISFTTFNIIYFAPDARMLLLTLSRFDISKYYNLEYGCSDI